MSGVTGISIGIGVMVLMFVISYAVYQLSRWIKPIADKEEKFELFEELCLDKLALKKGFNLPLEAEKRKMLKKNKYNIRNKIQEQMYEDMFGKEKEK